MMVGTTVVCRTTVVCIRDKDHVSIIPNGAIGRVVDTPTDRSVMVQFPEEVYPPSKGLQCMWHEWVAPFYGPFLPTAEEMYDLLDQGIEV